MKGVIEHVADSQCRHALTVQLVNVGPHVQQQVEHIMMAVYLTGAQNDARQSERDSVPPETSCLGSAPN